MLNIVIPMAGKGSRFANAGYELPKPLIEIRGKPMIEVVVNNLRPSCDHRFIFVCLKEHLDKFNLESRLSLISPDSIILGIDSLTEGAACTVLEARDYICNDYPLMVANSDQYIDINIDDYIQEMERRRLDGMIMTMRASDPKWSYVKVDSNGYVEIVKEKSVISHEATVGVYNFRSGKFFCDSAQAMIKNRELENGEFYVAPVYNRLIANRAKVGVYNIGEEANGMYGLGIPSDLELFLNHPVSSNV